MIPFYDMTRESLELISNGLMYDLEKTISSGQYLFGPQSEKLEKYFSEYFGIPSLLVGSGTDALVLSLMALGIKRGDKVAIPAMTAIPTATAVKMIGAQPIYIDIGTTTCTMQASCLVDAIKKHKNIKAIIAVHLYGNVCDISKLSYYSNGIPIIEDCAQSFGSTYKGKLTGTFGKLGAFSFYPSKNLGTFGDSGLIISKNIKYIEKIRQLRFYGQISRYKMGEDCGMNSRTDEVQSTILLNKTKFLSQKLGKRKILKKKYSEFLSNKFVTVRWSEGAVPHLFPIICDNREKLIEYLDSKGIQTAIHYPFYLEEEIEKTTKISCPKAKELSQKVLSIPFHPWLTDEEIDYILQSLGEFNENSFNR